MRARPLVHIVNLAFSLMLGAFAVAFAIAFGFGGRDMAAHLLRRWEQSIESENVEAKIVPPGEAGPAE